ncbi:MAG TPA: ABC transporter permease, partial [Candidatus Sulfopaludibacter sp.]|nr:ABC transporter permease [Candidatus Sulfopaludibacter sp.]
MLRDLLYGARNLRSSPAFAVAAILTLALGIGASTAIFSVANAVLLQPLPYQDPGRLVYVCSDMLKRNVYDHFWSDADFLDLRSHSTSVFEDAAAVLSRRVGLLNSDGVPDEIGFAAVTPNLFRLLGIRIVLGRDFIESDGLPQPAGVNGAPPAPDQRLPTMAIVGYGFFQRRFGGNPAALGEPIVKNGPILVGVTAPGAELLFRPDRNMERSPDLWVAARLNPGAPRVSIAWRVIARLRRGVSVRRAQAQTDAVAEQCRAADNINRTAGLSFRVEPMHEYLVAQVRPAILALMGAAVFLLLIACSNVANLFLVRSSLRSRDLAVRTAMCASWWRLARQMLAEALLAAALGSIAGFGLAWAGIRELLAIAPGNLPRLNAVAIDPAVLAFTMAAGALAAVLFGLMPALRAARPDVAQVLRASGRAAGLTGGALLRNCVVVAEVALCFVMLVGSGLMLRSFIALQRIDPGFDPRGVLTFRGLGGKPASTPEARQAAVRQMRDALAAVPGVESVTAASEMPLNGEFFPYRWGKEDAL